jgi:aminotransferase
MSAPTLSQAAGVEAMNHGAKDVARMRREYRRRRDYVHAALNRMGFETVMPNGAFYIFPSIRSTGMASEEFAMKLLKEFKVALVPGPAFGACGEGFVRISYATGFDQLEIAMERIARMLGSSC